MNKMQYTKLFIAVSAIFMLGLVLADPNGAGTISAVSSERFSSTEDPANHSAIAGNVTELTITGNSITQSWQGYFGNVSGAIELSDASGNQMYNWSLESPSGEVFASRDDSVTWTGIACFNWATNGVALEESFNINDSADGINETFTETDHTGFSVGTTSLSGCMSTDIFDSTGASVDGNFEEVLLQDGDSDAVFVALLEEDLTGFDSATHDFQMLVPEDGHNGDTSTTPYFFYVELE